ncbi:MAG TPA: ABC transporter substrate-binding protein [Advenella kashmirensis]|uniref:ABC transporter substrate-binding protein n=1 Tax=Advenella kashmirensis TaxID=310575 RepID=A0A356LC60_9BURK|nr:ABC transporter substrate-binding protein [Advenella kashmirensis]
MKHRHTATKRSILKFALLSLFCTGTTIVAPAAQAEFKPNQYITYIVPFAPGGLTDVAARMVAKGVGDKTGWNIVVNNKAGANGNLGPAEAARAKPDGNTWLAITMTHAVNITLFGPKAGYDIEKDFVPVAKIASSAIMVVVPQNSPINTLQDLIDTAKKKTLNVGSSGTGTPPHIAMALFQDLTKTKMTHVPYKGGAPSMVDLIGGQIDVVFSNYPESLAYVQQGKLRALAITSEKRAAAVPDVPTTAEAGLPGLMVDNFTGLMAPKGTDPALVKEISDKVTAVVGEKAMGDQLIKLGFIPDPMGPDQFKTYLHDQIEKLAKTIKDANIKVN